MFECTRVTMSVFVAVQNIICSLHNPKQVTISPPMQTRREKRRALLQTAVTGFALSFLPSLPSATLTAAGAVHCDVCTHAPLEHVADDS